MSGADLLALYLVVGLACAVAIYRTSDEPPARAAASAALALPLWPLWAPVALTSRRRRAEPEEPAPGSGSAERVRADLREAMAAADGSPMQALLSREAAGRIAAEVSRADARRRELEVLLRREAFDRDRARARVADLERREGLAEPLSGGAAAPLDPDGVSRALAAARLHLDNVERLRALHDRDARSLEELGDLVQALRTQLVLARYAGSSLEGVGGIVAEVWARVEGLEACEGGGAAEDVA